MYRKRILEVNGDISEISLPIVKFPPFKLRALLIEKDPVVWLHCLETYVSYLKFFAHQNNVEKLDNSTFNNLCIFLRSYLAEVAEDEERLLSLGMNHDVAEQLRLLRTYIFILIKKCGLLYLQIFNESLWDFIKFYVAKNPDTVRASIVGSLKPQINTQKARLNRIPQIQQYLKHKVEADKFTRVDLKAYESLLSQKSYKSSSFSKQFLTTDWLETLESWWSKGEGKHSEIARKLEIVSLMSVSAADIRDVMQELGMGDIETFLLYPLLGSLVMNETFQKKKPELVAMLPYLQLNISNEEDESSLSKIREEDLSTLSELFPHLTRHQLSQLLLHYDGNVETATNAVLEDPAIGDHLAKESLDGISSLATVEAEEELIDYSLKKRDPSREVTSKHVPDEVRNKTLTSALKLLYEKDEDEYDDTYDEAEATSTTSKISIDDKNAESSNSRDESYSGISKYEQVEGYLWDLLKQDKVLFERANRGSKRRKDIKSETGWSDEQIEGWARMLERSPHRARILEEKFMFRGNTKTGKSAYVKNRIETHNESKKSDQKSLDAKKKPTIDNKKQQARKEKNKSSKANHSRKSGHEKKIARAAP